MSLKNYVEMSNKEGEVFHLKNGEGSPPKN